MRALGGRCAYITGVDASPTSAGALKALLAQSFGEDAADVLEAYEGSEGPTGGRVRDEDAAGIWLNMSRDAGVSCPSLWLARRFASPPMPTRVNHISTNNIHTHSNVTSSKLR